jgi:hypothetical protein
MSIDQQTNFSFHPAIHYGEPFCGFIDVKARRMITFLVSALLQILCLKGLLPVVSALSALAALLYHGGMSRLVQGSLVTPKTG